MILLYIKSKYYPWLDQKSPKFEMIKLIVAKVVNKLFWTKYTKNIEWSHFWAFEIIWVYNKIVMGGYPDLNRKPTVPHTVALPIELHSPFFC